MVKISAKDKWNKVYSSELSSSLHVSDVLAEYEYLISNKGDALDLACGLGANALFLAKHGLNTTAWDISEEAISNLQNASKGSEIQLNTEVRDIETNPPSKESFDVICVSYFLDRNIISNIISALRLNGLLFYQTFIHEKVSDTGPGNPNYRLQANELLSLFSPLHVLVYKELGRVGDVTKGLRDVAYLVAQKR